MKSINILKEFLLKDTILFDGAIGTYISQKYNVSVSNCERENLGNPQHVLDVHKEYIAAGAQAIKTNTFAANSVALNAESEYVAQVVRAGCDIAFEAAGDNTLVFANIGPIYSQSAANEYKHIIDIFLEKGVKHFLFETFLAYEPLIEATEYVKSKEPNSFVICECTVKPDKYTNSGVFAQDIANELQNCKHVDAYGFNCTCGPLHMANLAKSLEFCGKPISMMPNAGYPTIIDGRTVFESTPSYFAKQVMSIHRMGINILGGCCGTTPAHIAAVKKALEKDITQYSFNQKTQKSEQSSNNGCIKKGYIAVELDAPANADTAYFVSSARQISASGADIITIADCPIGRAKADSSILACMLKQQHGIDAMPHLTCRDRNINASKALLLGMYMQNINKLLIVTGDPIPAQERDMVKGVYQFNSVRYASFINSLNNDVFSERPFEIMGAINVNAQNFSAELDKAEKKVTAGMSCLLTQPVMDERAIKNLALAKSRLSINILAGIMPVVSYKNARFINNEVAGITVPEELLEKYSTAEPADYPKIAVEFALSIAKAVKEIADGYYIITSLRRADIVSEIVKEIRNWQF